MNAKLNSPYVENYAVQISQKICGTYFSQKKYMTGQEILQLTPASQVNFFVIKTLFEAWQAELEKMKSNPYFDYRDKNVHEALKEFMNVLSRTIKIEKEHFLPLLTEAVAYSILLAVDPVAYFTEEFEKTPEDQLPHYVKDNKKYFKWHTSLVSNLVDRAGLGYSVKAYKAAVINNYEQQKDTLEKYESLLIGLHSILPLDFDKLIGNEKALAQATQEKEMGKTPDLPKREKVEEHVAKVESVEVKPQEATIEKPVEKAMEPVEAEKPQPTVQASADFAPGKGIDPLKAWARFENEEYSIMKGTIKELSESIGINQRIMFTKELFEGNPDLLTHALKSIDRCENFVEAIELINQRYVMELKWNKESDQVTEFLQLVFRKFDHRG
ncbi:hypothetical protein [Arthrospiribacter ruber]|uniref:Uncharacterized protein n=1 Tax=Arthrospiribacter ruber TaxID=2487934 RepID=A0A951MCK2_9BACT|nr:hypothetical protein [Arthrospiribacter ruber]MBW3467607.1 hypothetical protein [Arthrospiribacter ruber]